jgi:PKD repeat protein
MAGLGAYAPVIPPDNPPVAKLSVSQLSSPALTVKADGSGSTDTDSTPIASYRFDFGDGTTAVTTTAPTATAQHSYAAAGSYTVTLIATDTGGHASSPASATINVTAPSTSAPVAVYAGYYDTHHSYYLKQKPSPWRGASNVIFVGSQDGGTTDGWDTSALRVDNLSSGTISVNATVDIGTHHYALWSPQNVPAGWTVVFAQTALENFDGSDTNPAGCYGCNPDLCTTMVSHTVPLVNLTVNGTATTYSDPDQVLNTNGVDAAGCPATGTRNDESHPWTQIQPNPTGTSAHAQPSGNGATEFQTAANLGIPVPNPARDNVMIRFSVVTRGAVRVGVYDIAGRLAAPGVDGELEAGDYNLQINLTDKPAGLYIVRLSTAAGTSQRKFTHVR